MPEDLDKIEAEMKKIIKENPHPKRLELSRCDAVAYFEKTGEPYKVELTNAIEEGQPISLYEQGDFTDLCAGPHLYDLSTIKALKLTSIAGAYWRGNENNRMLQRIYGISFPKQSMLDEYLALLEEAKNVTIANWAKNWTYFPLWKKARDFLSFIRTA